MKADSNAAFGFVPAASANSGGAPRANRSDGGGDDQFARLMRQSESRDTARRSDTDRPATRSEARHEPARRSEAPNERSTARTQAERNAAARTRTTQDTAAKANAATAPDEADAVARDTAVATDGHTAPLAAIPDDEQALPLDWPPAGLILPTLLTDPALTPANPATGFAAGDILLGGARALPAPGLPGVPGLPAAALASGTDAATLPGDPAGLSGEVPAQAATGAAASRAETATTPAPATAQANPAVNTPTPASDPAALALPAGMVLFKDTLEALAAGKREEMNPMSAALAANGPAPSSDTGLARTATVNPLTALTPDLNTDQFGETLGTQLTYMADQKISHARIRVSPHEMGTIEINLRLDGDRVHADFSSPQADVRQALESSLPKLRDLLGQQGFQLAQADVGHRDSSQSSPSSNGERTGLGPDTGVMAGDTAPTAPVVRIVRGLLDAYA